MSSDGLGGPPTPQFVGAWRSGAYPRRPSSTMPPTALSLPPPKRARWHAAAVLVIALGGALGLVMMHGWLMQLAASSSAAGGALTSQTVAAIQTAAGQTATVADPIADEDVLDVPFDIAVAAFVLSRAAKRAAVVCALRGGPRQAELAVTFARDGTVTRAQVLDDWSDTVPGRCLARELASAQIVPFEGEAPEVRFTVELL